MSWAGVGGRFTPVMLHLLNCQQSGGRDCMVRGVIIWKWKKGRNGAYSPKKSTGNIKKNTAVTTFFIISRKKTDKTIQYFHLPIPWNIWFEIRFPTVSMPFSSKNNSIHKQWTNQHKVIWHSFPMYGQHNWVDILRTAISIKGPGPPRQVMCPILMRPLVRTGLIV